MILTVVQMRQDFETRLKTHIHSLGIQKSLLTPLKHALFGSGKRIRPLLVLLIAKALGGNRDVYPAAFCCEFFHTASLIADDLPCMDNDDMRRDKKSLHKAFDEETALLVSYGLISQGFKEMHNNYELMKKNQQFSLEHCSQVLSTVLQEACHFSGFQGAIQGQYNDLKVGSVDEKTSKKIHDGKTGTLFVGTFVLGYLFGGGDINRLEIIKKGALHFGSAFQIFDDIGDYDTDLTKENSANMACILGKATAELRCKEHLLVFKKMLQEEFIDPKMLTDLVDKYFTSIL